MVESLASSTISVFSTIDVLSFNSFALGRVALEWEPDCPNWLTGRLSTVTGLLAHCPIAYLTNLATFCRLVGEKTCHISHPWVTCMCARVCTPSREKQKRAFRLKHSALPSWSCICFSEPATEGIPTERDEAIQTCPEKEDAGEKNICLFGIGIFWADCF